MTRPARHSPDTLPDAHADTPRHSSTHSSATLSGTPDTPHVRRRTRRRPRRDTPLRAVSLLACRAAPARRETLGGHSLLVHAQLVNADGQRLRPLRLRRRQRQRLRRLRRLRRRRRSDTDERRAGTSRSTRRGGLGQITAVAVVADETRAHVAETGAPQRPPPSGAPRAKISVLWQAMRRRRPVRSGRRRLSWAAPTPQRRHRRRRDGDDPAVSGHRESRP